MRYIVLVKWFILVFVCYFNIICCKCFIELWCLCKKFLISWCSEGNGVDVYFVILCEGVIFKMFFLVMDVKNIFFLLFIRDFLFLIWKNERGN